MLKYYGISTVVVYVRGEIILTRLIKHRVQYLYTHTHTNLGVDVKILSSSIDPVDKFPTPKYQRILERVLQNRSFNQFQFKIVIHLAFLILLRFYIINRLLPSSERVTRVITIPKYVMIVRNSTYKNSKIANY